MYILFKMKPIKFSVFNTSTSIRCCVVFYIDINKYKYQTLNM